MDTGYSARLGVGPLAAGAAAAVPTGLQVWPNPAAGGGGVWVQGAKAGQAVQVLDLLGQVVGQGPMPAAGPLRLELAGCAAGVYVVRSGGQARRLVIE